jgi:hypothetical protein
VGRRRLDAPAPLPDPRLRGRQLLRVGVEAHPRERSCGRALPSGGRRARGHGDRARQPRGSGAEERSGPLRPRAGCRRGRRADPQGRSRGAAAGGPHGHAPVSVRDVRRGLPRLGPLAAACGRPLVRRSVGRRSRLPGGQVPPARGRQPPRPAPAGPPGPDGHGGQPDARRVTGPGTPVRVDRPRRRDRRSAARRGGLRSCADGREAGGGGCARSPVRPAPRGAPERPPDLARGLGGAAGGHADDGARPEPGPGRRAHARFGEHCEGRCPAGRRGADPPGARASDRAAGRAAHVRGRPWCPGSARLEPGARGGRRARRRVLQGVRERRARPASGCSSRSTCQAR